MKLPTVLLLAIALSMPVSTHAESTVSPQEVQVMVNTLKYIVGLPPADKPLQILALYDASLPDSKAQAEAFVQQVSVNKTAKARHVVARISTLQDGASGAAPLVFIPTGFSAHYKEVAELAKNKHVFPITTDKDCVAAKACALSFSVGDSIEIFLSEDALKTSGFDVDAAFRFMARPI